MKQRSGAAIAAMIRKATAIEMARQIGEAGFQGRALSAHIIISLYHSESLQAYVPMLADDQMVMNRDFERVSNGDNLAGKMDIVGRRLRIA